MALLVGQLIEVQIRLQRIQEWSTAKKEKWFDTYHQSDGVVEIVLSTFAKKIPMPFPTEMLVKKASTIASELQSNGDLPFPMHRWIQMISCKTCSNRHSSDSCSKVERDRHWPVCDSSSIYWCRWTRSIVDPWINSEEQNSARTNSILSNTYVLHCPSIGWKMFEVMLVLLAAFEMLFERKRERETISDTPLINSRKESLFVYENIVYRCHTYSNRSPSFPCSDERKSVTTNQKPGLLSWRWNMRHVWMEWATTRSRSGCIVV